MPLFHPFNAGLIDYPKAGERWLFSGALHEMVPPEGFSAEFLCVQGFRPHFLALEKAGWRVFAEMQDDMADLEGALMLMGRSRDDNLLRLQGVLRAVRPGGMIVIAGGKTQGASSFRKLLARHVADLDHASKHHGIAMWFRRPAEWVADDIAPMPQVEQGIYVTAAGGFSADGPDPASVMLADHFFGKLEGAVADFGAGWGYLGVQALQRCSAIVSLESFEADWRSLAAARINLARAGSQAKLAFHWQDLTTEAVARRFDRIIMNPPFHFARAADPAIGIAFIQAASAALKPGGRLLVVANRNLPYEQTLTAGFRRMEKIEEGGGFKIFEAWR
ncbi:MAG: class I SAM-dependent methyltransferase [Rhizobiaceae bacterium]